tara:strand:- start:181 stop:711 length:531 start_codon:yes stop_codon:yes gene_type:complete
MPDEKIEDMLLEAETIKEEVQALRDVSSGIEVSAEDAEIADKAIIKELISPTSKRAEYATFRNYNGDKEIIDILSHASSYESKLKLYNLYANKYGQDEDLFNTVESFKPQDIIPKPVTPTQELFGPPVELASQISKLLIKQANNEPLTRQERAILRSQDVEEIDIDTLSRFDRGKR